MVVCDEIVLRLLQQPACACATPCLRESYAGRGVVDDSSRA